MADDRLELAAMEIRTDLDPAFHRQQILNLTGALERDERRRWDAAMNAASGFARLGDLAKTQAFLLIASEDPILAADVATLRALITQQATRPN